MNEIPIRVLLVEDEASDAYLVKIGLKQAKQASFELIWVASLAEALQQLNDTCFDVVLLDLLLPDSAGLATIKSVRLAAGEIPIVILTGHNDTDFSLTALEAGATDYMVKGDFGFDGLARVIRYAVLRVEMEAHNRLLVAALNAAANGIVITDKEAVIRWINPAFSRLTGYSTEEAIGRKPNELIKSGVQDAIFYDEMWEQLLAGKHWRGEIVNKRKDGSLYHEELNIASVKNGRGDITHFIGIKEDISERKALEETIKQLAFYDPLTQLPNRRLLGERLKHGIETNRRSGNKMAVLMLDLDKFKAVNDSLGHAAGDELLQQVAIRIKACLREVDTVARLGGDEFVILMENLEQSEHVARVANKIIHTLKKPFSLSENHSVVIDDPNTEIVLQPNDDNMDHAHTALHYAKGSLLDSMEQSEHVARVANDIIRTLEQPFTLIENQFAMIGASIGIAIHPHHGDSVDVLMDHADTALYHAKESGRGCFSYFSEDLTQNTLQRLALEARLRYAVEQQQLQIYFQPKIDINSGRIVGAETLVGWHDSVQGLIMPKDFIAIAEETGLIISIGEWVLRETCQLGRQWLDQGLPPIALAVNISPYQFRRCDINELVAKVLSESGFPAAYLTLEITEGSLIENQQHAITVLKALHQQGVRLAIDDFGTGYSSLAYLKYFPLDELKIDKTFVNEISFLSGDMAITAAIIAMAHHLGLKVSIEGVETAEQLALLREHHCDSYQGYLYSQALPANEFATLLANLSLT